MKIALPYTMGIGTLFQHFGKTDYFKVYTIDDATKEFLSADILSTEGRQHEDIASFLKENGIDTVICGGVGDRMVSLLQSLGIQCYTSQEGDVDLIVRSFLNGTMEKHTEATHHCHHGE